MHSNDEDRRGSPKLTSSMGTCIQFKFEYTSAFGHEVLIKYIVMNKLLHMPSSFLYHLSIIHGSYHSYNSILVFRLQDIIYIKLPFAF